MTKQTYEDGDTVTYQYDNSGALATVTDSSSGRTATYYYDFTDRLMKYTESADSYDFSVGYAYDEINNLTALIETINGVDHTTAYTYDDDNRVTSVGNGDGSKTYTYDNFSRVSQREAKSGNTTVHTDTFTYRSPSADKTTGQVASLSVAAIGFSKTYSYTYDSNGNIESVSDGSNTTSYVYDSAGQLLRENNQAADKTWVWTYDDAGNILSRSEYSYTTGELGTASDTVTYAYNDSGWGDLLTSYDDTTIYVDAIGNPVSDGTWSYDWHHGRQLEKLSGEGPNGHVSVEYTYDANGLRTEKTVTTKAFEAVGTRTGLFLCSDGEIRYFENGTPSYAGLIQDEDGNYYYINSSLTAVRNRTYWISNHNNLLIESPYTFGHDGRMVVDEAYAEGGTLFSGLRRDADGEIRYYMSGVPVYAGLIQYEDGNYYYINSSMVAVRNCSYYISTTNGLLPEGTYSFDENGVLIDPPTETETAAAASTFSTTAYRVLVPDQTTTYTYTYNGGSLVQMSAGNDILYFAYDTSGPMSVTWNDTTYFYVTNLQGDVVAILDVNGTAVVTYTYDAWGRILTTGGTLANSLGSINPLRYRGYVYDTESGLYYLQNRFYDPEVSRFINADAYASTGQGTIGFNMFSYCLNRPISLTDSTGDRCVAYLDDSSDNAGRIFTEWYLATDENETDDFGQLTIDAKLKQTYQALAKNFRMDFGIGLGAFVGFTLFEILEVDIGLYYDVFRISIAQGKCNIYEYGYKGISISAMSLTLSDSTEIYRPYSVKGSTWMSFESEDTVPLLGGSVYFFGGGTLAIGYDLNSLIRDIRRIWR